MEDSKRIEEFYEEKMFCHHCDDSLAGHRYVLRDDHPYCIKCYENVFANNCDECGKIIGIDSKVSVKCLLGRYFFFGDIFMKMSSGCVFSPGHTYRKQGNCCLPYSYTYPADSPKNRDCTFIKKSLKAHDFGNHVGRIFK